MASDFRDEFPLILDGHEDFLTQMSGYQNLPGGGSFEEGSEPRRRDFLAESGDGHVDLPRARKGGIGAAFASIWMRDADAERDARATAATEIDDLLRTVDRASGQVRLVRSVKDLRGCLNGEAFGAILHFEGADPISPDLRELRMYYEAGLRSLGIVWSRSTAFGHGVSLRGGALPEGGLTEAGKNLVAECNRLGILIDVSHLNVAGFWDVVEACKRPFVATHSDAYAVSPHVRNLNDDQLRAIATAGGCVGINLANSFIRPDRGRDRSTTLDMVIAHVDHIAKLVGDAHVAIGTDFDGTDVPEVLSDATRLPLLLRELKRRGYSDDALERITHGNFVRVLEQVWR
jgi:membrane dipeptidase